MPTQKPSQPPDFDAGTTWAVLRDELRKGEAHVVVDGQKLPVVDQGDQYQVFQDKAFPRWKRWVDGTGEFDGKGLRDVVNGLAIFGDQLKEDIDAHKAADLNRHQTINQRLAALEAAVQSPPFPG